MIHYTPRSYRRLVELVLKYGMVRNDTRELINANLFTRNPRDRLITDRARKMNLPFGFAEWISMMTGESDLSFFKQFIANYDRFADGDQVDTYGRRLLDSNQLWWIVDKLKRDSSTRQAVLSIYRGADLSLSRNVPCTLTLQFLSSGGELNLITTMRSNDIYWGLTYDWMLFTLLQEWVAARVGMSLGWYYHNAGSLHVYNRDVYTLSKLTAGSRWPRVMLPMGRILQPEIDALRACYQNLGTDEFVEHVAGLSRFGSDVAYVGRAWMLRKTAPDVSKRCFGSIHDYTLRYVLRPWLVSAGTIEEKEKVR